MNQGLALQKIEDYSTGSSALTQAIYTEAGISGVVIIALDTINTLIAAAADGAADTVAEVQDIVNQGLALQRIEDYTAGSSALTQAIYTEAGVMGVTVIALDTINALIAAAVDGAADTVAEVQDIVNQGLALQKIEDYSTDSSALTQATYTEAGVVGVTVIALDTINALIAAAADDAADTVAEVQDIVNQGLALQRIEDYTAGSSALTQAI